MARQNIPNFRNPALPSSYVAPAPFIKLINANPFLSASEKVCQRSSRRVCALMCVVPSDEIGFNMRAQALAPSLYQLGGVPVPFNIDMCGQIA